MDPAFRDVKSRGFSVPEAVELAIGYAPAAELAGVAVQYAGESEAWARFGADLLARHGISVRPWAEGDQDAEEDGESSDHGPEG